jgi:hypothetical protein
MAPAAAPPADNRLAVGAPLPGSSSFSGRPRERCGVSKGAYFWAAVERFGLAQVSAISVALTVRTSHGNWEEPCPDSAR